MPRKRRTADGAPAQAVRVAPNQMFGRASEQEQALRAVPAAAERPVVERTTRRPLSPATSLLAPTQRPDEPVTAGARLGPGPGPEALGLPIDDEDLSEWAPVLIELARVPGASPELADLAERARFRYGL